MGAVQKDISFNCGFGAQILPLAESFVPDDAESSNSPSSPRRMVSRLTAPIPGVVLCVLISLVALGAQNLEERAFAHPYVEALVIAILLGAAVRTVWNPPERWSVGITFSAKQLLELAVMLLGASISFAAIAAAGSLLMAAIVATVAVALAVSYSLSRMFGLSTRLAILIACGNSICGNSARRR